MLGRGFVGKGGVKKEMGMPVGVGGNLSLGKSIADRFEVSRTCAGSFAFVLHKQDQEDQDRHACLVFV